MLGEKLLFLIFLLLIPLASATIELNTLSDKYSLGESPSITAKIVPGQTASALITSTLTCADFELPYFITPIEITQNQEKTVSIPNLILPKKGDNCYINIGLQSTKGVPIESQETSKFSITDQLDVSLNDIPLELAPGEKLKLFGSVKKETGSLGQITLSLVIGDKSSSVSIGKSFNEEFIIPLNIESGKQTMAVKIEDSFSNTWQRVVDVNIKPVVKEIIAIVTKKAKPGETIKIIENLHDQAGDLMDAKINLLFTDPEGNAVFESQLSTYEPLEYKIKEYSIPGQYILKSTFESLEREDTIEIEAVREVNVAVEGNLVNIKNAGNVNYKGQTTIILEQGDKTYFVTKKLSLDPGETLAFDLTKEVPAGEYDVKIEETKETLKENLTLEQDNRNIFKKASQGIWSITGRATFGNGLLAKRPKLTLAIFIIIILVIVIYFIKGKIHVSVEHGREASKRKEEYNFNDGNITHEDINDLLLKKGKIKEDGLDLR